MHPSSKTRFLLGIACSYSFLLFFIANYLPLITNGAAQILTWVVYAKIVRGLVIFLGAVLLFVAFVRWPQVPQRRWFLLQLVPFAAISALLFGRLGDSVNEYIHYPQYATCVLLWHLPLKRLGPERAPRVPVLSRLTGRFGAVAVALAVSAVLGMAEEGFQYIEPRRRFDLQDLALNVMGVWLGAILVWLLSERNPTGTDSTGNDVAREGRAI